VGSDAEVAVANQSVFAVFGSGEIHEIHIPSGEHITTYNAIVDVHDLPAEGNLDNLRLDAVSSIVGNMLYIGDDDGQLYAVDLNKDKMRWKFNLGADHFPGGNPGIKTSPVVIDDVLYVTRWDGTVFALAPGSEV